LRSVSGNTSVRSLTRAMGSPSASQARACSSLAAVSFEPSRRGCGAKKPGAQQKTAWQGGSFLSSVPLYEYLKARVQAVVPKAKDEQWEYGRRIVLPEVAGSRFDIREKRSAGWNLPYEIGDVDFDANRVVLAFKFPVDGLPRELIFEGPGGQL